MAYSAREKEVVELNDELDAILGPFSLKQIGVCAKTLVGAHDFIFKELYKKARKTFFYLTMRQDPEKGPKAQQRQFEKRMLEYKEQDRRFREREKSVVEVVGIEDAKFPEEEKLEGICESIAKEIEAENKGIKVEFAGLVYHLYAEFERNPDGGEGSINYNGNLRDFSLDPKDFHRNRIDAYTIDGNSFYGMIKLFAPLDGVDETLPVKASDKVSISPDTYVGGLIEITDRSSEDYKSFRVCISPAGRKIHSTLSSGDRDHSIRKGIVLQNNYPGYMVFVAPPSMGNIKEAVIQKYSKHSGVIEVPASV